MAIINPMMQTTKDIAPAVPTAGSDMALRFASLLPFTIKPSAKSASASACCIPVISSMAIVTKKPTK